MRIGVNTRVLLSSRMEGVCRYIHETLRRIVLDHPEDQFYFFFDRPYDDRFVYAPNVIPIVIGPQARHPFLWYLWFEFSLTRAMKKHKIDVLYSGDTYMSLRTKVPTVLVSHDIAYAHYPEHIPWLNRLYYQKNFPRFHQKAKLILAVSAFTKSDIIEKYNLEKSKVRLAYNDVKEGLSPITKESKVEIKNKYSSGEDFFLYVGSIHPRKNVVRLIEAFDAFKEKTGSKKKLIIAGRLAWNVEAFKSALAYAKCKTDIIHFSDLRNAELNKITASAFALIYVSLFEGFGLPILEAMHCDVPVISSKISSMPEVAGNAAILVDPKKVDEIATAIEKIESDTDMRIALIESGKTQRLKFNWQTTVDVTYQALLDATQ